VASVISVIPSPMTFAELLKSVKTVLMNKQMWLIGIIGCLFYLPASVFLDLWGIPFLKTVYQLDPETAASVVSMTFVGWIIAGPSIGAFSDHIKRRRLPLQVCALMAAILLSIIFYVPGITLPTLYVLFFFVGVFCGAHPLCFALGKENNPIKISGTALAITNTLIMLGGAVFQPVVGKLLDWHTTSAAVVDGMPPAYTPGDYIYALSLIPVGLILAIGLTFLLRETYCESQEVLNSDRPTAKVFKLRTERA
jgi:MFS family permease